MGNYLSTPDTEKHFDESGDGVIICSMRGWRRTNEDSHIAYVGQKSEQKSEEKSEQKNEDIKIYAVFDGHGCQSGNVSKWLGDNFCKFFQPNDVTEKNIEDKIKETFIKCDHYMIEHNEELEKYNKPFENKPCNLSKLCGSTCCMVILLNDKIYTANIGDS